MGSNPTGPAIGSNHVCGYGGSAYQATFHMLTLGYSEIEMSAEERIKCTVFGREAKFFLEPFLRRQLTACNVLHLKAPARVH